MRYIYLTIYVPKYHGAACECIKLPDEQRPTSEVFTNVVRNMFKLSNPARVAMPGNSLPATNPHTKAATNNGAKRQEAKTGRPVKAF